MASRVIKPLLYVSSAGAIGASVLYLTYRPRDIPGSEPAAVPPPIYGEGGIFQLPDFPNVQARAEHIEALKRSCATNSPPSHGQTLLRRMRWLVGLGGSWEQRQQQSGSGVGEKGDFAEDGDGDEPYDLLIIGGGATGAGIALDAATRGLKVAMVERDDFSSGTSSKSTKLVHGGVRYLEKAVWELDYSQYRLVKDALRERRYFLDTAPHLSMWLPIMIPLDSWWKAPYFWAGTKFYDILAGSENIESSYFLTRSKALDAFPMLRKEGLKGALVYYGMSYNSVLQYYPVLIDHRWCTQ
jgi:glycerol-3-phosphate dehydrogenase